MSLESESRLATPLKVPPPTRTFVAIIPLNYQASSAGGSSAMDSAARSRRGGAWIDLGRWRWGPGTVSNSSVSTPLHFDSRTAHFCVPTVLSTVSGESRWLRRAARCRRIATPASTQVLGTSTAPRKLCWQQVSAPAIEHQPIAVIPWAGWQRALRKVHARKSVPRCRRRCVQVSSSAAWSCTPRRRQPQGKNPSPTVL